MRADTKVTLIVSGERTYDEATGNYETTTNTETEVYGLVTDTGTERMNLLYGGVNQHAKTIRLNAPTSVIPDLIAIDGHNYQIDNQTSYRRKQTFEVSRV